MTASWNVNGKKPQNEKKGLASWLCLKPAPDIYIVGYHSPSNFVALHHSLTHAICVN
jgi:hypothetical protein